MNSFPCTNCQEGVTDEDMALECDICEEWEHVSCLRGPDKLNKTLYRALTNYQSIVCIHYIIDVIKRGCYPSICISLNALVDEQRLASECLLEETTHLLKAIRMNRKLICMKNCRTTGNFCMHSSKLRYL